MKKLLAVSIMAIALTLGAAPLFASTQAESTTPAPQQAPATNEEAAQKFSEAVGQTISSLSWPDPSVFGYAGNESPEGTSIRIRLWGGYFLKNGDWRQKLLGSVLVSDITPQTWEKLANDFSTKLTAFFNEMQEALARGELMPKESLAPLTPGLAPLTPGEEAAWRTFESATQALRVAYVVKLKAANPNFEAIPARAYLIENQRIVLFYVKMKDADNLSQFYVLAQAPLSDFAGLTDEEIVEKTRPIFDKAADFLKNHKP